MITLSELTSNFFNYELLIFNLNQIISLFNYLLPSTCIPFLPFFLLIPCFILLHMLYFQKDLEFLEDRTSTSPFLILLYVYLMLLLIFVSGFYLKLLVGKYHLC